jgi:hypothetical protein
MADGTRKRAGEISVGDRVMTAKHTPETVLKIESSFKEERKRMVRLGDFLITRGHPVFVNGTTFPFSSLAPSPSFPFCICPPPFPSLPIPLLFLMFTLCRGLVQARRALSPHELDVGTNCQFCTERD